MTTGYRRFRARPVRAQARQVDEHTIVVTRQGVVYATRGEWIVIDAEGHIDVFSNVRFQAVYELDDDGRVLR